MCRELVKNDTPARFVGDVLVKDDAKWTNHRAPAPSSDEELRAVLQSARHALAAAISTQQAGGAASPPTSSGVKLQDPELLRLRDQLLKVASGAQRPGAWVCKHKKCMHTLCTTLAQPSAFYAASDTATTPMFCLHAGPEALARAQQLLTAACRLLQSSGSVQTATALLYTAGEALARTEHMVRSTGQVCFWGPPAVGAALALLQLYAQLAQHAAQPHPAALPLRAAMERLILGRVELLVLVTDMLELLHFSPDYQVQCHSVQDAVTPALVLWDMLRGLVRFAGLALSSPPPSQQQSQHAQQPTSPTGGAAADGRASVTHSSSNPAKQRKYMLGRALAKVHTLLAPGGTAPRVLARPFTQDTAPAHLAILQLLKQLFDIRETHLLDQHDIADHYVRLHYSAFLGYYQAAGNDARSAAAELAKIHLKVGRVWGRGGCLYLCACMCVLGFVQLCLLL